MIKRGTLIIIAAAAAAYMALAIGSASANRLSVSNRTFRIVWNPLTFSGGFIALQCAVTLEGSLHSTTIAKVLGALIGYINRAAVGPCTELFGYRASFESESLPWHVKYDGFTGTLPNITGIKTRVGGKREKLEEVGIHLCTWHPANAEGMESTLNVSGGLITGVTLEAPGSSLSLLRRYSTFECIDPIAERGRGRYTVQGSATGVTIRLI